MVISADLFLWRNKKISVGVLAGATAIWLLFEEKNEHTQEKEQAQEKKSEQEKKAPDCCCWNVEDLVSVTTLHRLPPVDVARAACACRLLSTVASDRAVLEATFRAPWGVRHVLSDPATRAFWRAASLARFALSRALCRGVTVSGIALKYSVQMLAFILQKLGVQEL
ncbi:F-box protein At1g55000-like [Triticum urartu]|uniref:F-box protein At1g55000-like n=1 Tax=Triticum urartu TaxID=4572 RepID=UPI002043B67E|nr:F-box protein At1g55000-like [Triticum urartu]